MFSKLKKSGLKYKEPGHVRGRNSIYQDSVRANWHDPRVEVESRRSRGKKLKSNMSFHKTPPKVMPSVFGNDDYIRSQQRLGAGKRSFVMKTPNEGKKGKTPGYLRPTRTSAMRKSFKG